MTLSPESRLGNSRRVDGSSPGPDNRRPFQLSFRPQSAPVVRRSPFPALAAADSPKPTLALGGVRLVVASLARMDLLVLMAPDRAWLASVARERLRLIQNRLHYVLEFDCGSVDDRDLYELAIEYAARGRDDAGNRVVRIRT